MARKLKPRLMKTLLNVKKTGTQGKQYRVQPSKVRDDEIKKMVKMVNDSLYRLEKSNMEGASAIYRTIESYALSDPNGKGKIYNVNDEKGTIRITKDLSRFGSGEEKSKFVNVLRNILTSKTRTVTGTRESLKKGYETAKEKYNFSGDAKKYGDLWKAYTDNVSKETRSHLGSNLVLQLMENTDIYSMSEEQMNQAMSFVNGMNDLDDAINGLLEEYPNLVINF